MKNAGENACKQLNIFLVLNNKLDVGYSQDSGERL